MNEKTYDPEETAEEQAARRIDKAAALFADRCDHFNRTLRSNAKDLTPYKRQLVLGWVKRHGERLQTSIEDQGGIPPLGLDGLPDIDDR